MNIGQIKELLQKGEKVNLECKEAKKEMPKSAYESYSAFANTYGGTIILGIYEDSKANSENRFIIKGVENASKIIDEFWNTINSTKVNVNLLTDENVYIVNDKEKELVVIEVPRADYKLRPVFLNGNPYKGTYKRNNQGDYHCSESEIRAMIRDQNPEGNDGIILEGYTMDDIDADTLKRYRQSFNLFNLGHAWENLDDRTFLEKLGGYRKDRKTGIEGLTCAGLLMFGTGLAIRDEFSHILMDYRDEQNATVDLRWNDRVTYDGTWENNLFNFFNKVLPKLTADLKKPFKLEGARRIDDTPVHKAVREAFVNMIIHSDYLVEGTLKALRIDDGFSFTNPGILKLSKDEIFKGGNSKPRNPRMQTMLRLVGYGDNAGSGFPTILKVWEDEGWIEPELIENVSLNQVELRLMMIPKRNVPVNNTDDTVNDIINDTINDTIKLTSNEMLIMNFIKTNSNITIKELEKQVPISRPTINRYIKALKKKGILEREGSNKTGSWKINLPNIDKEN